MAGISPGCERSGGRRFVASQCSERMPDWRFFADWLRRTIAALLFISAAHVAIAEPSDVTFAGVAFSGDAATLDQRFSYSRRYEKGLEASGDSSYKKTLAAVARVTPHNIRLVTTPIDSLKGQDQALVASLLINSETVSVERFGDIRKLFVLLRGEVLFFDFKSMTVVRAYPISFAYIDNATHDPSQDEILDAVKKVYEGWSGKPGIFERFANRLVDATIPSQSTRYLQITSSEVAPDVVALLPDYLKSAPSVYQTWFADLVGEAISTRVGLPIIPFTKGYAVGKVMSMQFMDGSVYNLTLPKPDYEIGVTFKGSKKVKYSESGAGAAYIYGTYAAVQLEEPLTGTSYLNASFKNGEVKLVPASQTYVDDFPAYYDSINGLFHKLADALAGNENAWVKAASGSPDIEHQIAKTKELMNLCK